MPTIRLADDPYVKVVGPDTEELLQSKLGPVTGPDRKGEFTAQCPAHVDDVASLRFRAAVDGKALLFCHAGCTSAEIAKAIGVEFYMLAPLRIEYDYFTPDSAYAFTVVKSFGADGKSKVSQMVRAGAEDGSDLYDVSGVETDILFRGDEVREAERGPCEVLWIPEGEKDAAVAAAIFAAEEVRGEYAVSFPGGAMRDLSGIAGRLVEATGTRSVVIPCDRDKSGVGERRGRSLAAVLSVEAPDVAVTVMLPKEGEGKDLAEVYDRHGAKWRDFFEVIEVDAEADAVLALEGSVGAGSLVRVPLPGGRSVLAMLKESKTGEEVPVQVLTGSIEPIAAWGGDDPGWVVAVSNQIAMIPTVETKLRAADLTNNRTFQSWLVTTSIGRTPGCVIGHGDIAESLRLYLQHRVIASGIGVAVVPETAGWVDGDTGENADAAEDSRDLIFVDGSGRIVAASTADGAEGRVVTTPREAGGREAGEYGVEVSEVDAAWAVWQTLTFADPAVTAPTLGWVAATVLGPMLRTAGCAVRPGLAVVAPAESGKSLGATAMLLRLGGATNSDSTPAAFRRKLQRGVGTIVWVDDSGLIENEDVKKWMRTAASRERFEISDTDRGHNATMGSWLTAATAVSAEGVGWTKEKAMADRFVAVHPTNPRGRTSWWEGHEESLQWSDFRKVEEDLGGRPGKASGRVVVGLVESARALGRGDVFRGVREAFEAVGDGVGRRASVQAAVAAGLEIALAWMERVRAEAGEAWPGRGQWWAEETDWIRAGLREWKGSELDETEEASCGLVNDVLPAVLVSHSKGMTRSGVEAVATDIDASSAEVLRAGVARFMGTHAGPVRGWPAAIVDREGRVWVQLQILEATYKDVTRGRGGREETVNLTAMTQQIDGVRDNPGWASYAKNGRTVTGLRMTSSARPGRPVYNRLTEAASIRAIGLANG